MLNLAGKILIYQIMIDHLTNVASTMHHAWESYLKMKDLIPDLIISSTAARAKKTAELVVKACKYKGEEIVSTHSLYGAELAEDYLKILKGLSDKHKAVLVVGHSPSVEETIEMITNSSDVIMSTCALAHIRLPIENWAELTKEMIKGKLVKVWRPKKLS
jgi:phosphohistidine phosphatase